jgi:hypothetical protein
LYIVKPWQTKLITSHAKEYFSAPDALGCFLRNKKGDLKAAVSLDIALLVTLLSFFWLSR